MDIVQQTAFTKIANSIYFSNGKTMVLYNAPLLKFTEVKKKKKRISPSNK